MFNSSEPLWLPAGSVRAVLALFVTVVGFGYLVASGGDVLPLITLVLGFYFGTKDTRAAPPPAAE